jgi:hypothetical protein
VLSSFMEQPVLLVEQRPPLRRAGPVAGEEAA